MPVGLFAEAAASLAKEAGPAVGDQLRQRAEAQAAVLRWGRASR
jgi:hypothetical protein